MRRLILIAISLAFLFALASDEARAQQFASQSPILSNVAGDLAQASPSRLFAHALRSRQKSFSLMSESSQAGVKLNAPALSILPTSVMAAVTGSGTPGRLSKWSGVGGSNTFVLGDSNIFEDKFGKVGIGTDTPTSLLTVAGTLEATSGVFSSLSIGTSPPSAGLSIVVSSATPAIFASNSGNGGGMVGLCGGVNPIPPGPRGVIGFCSPGVGVRGQSVSNTGVLGASQSAFGVNGESDTGVGVRGLSSSAPGVAAISISGNGLESTTTSTSPGKAAVMAMGSPFAGEAVAAILQGNVHIQKNSLQQGDLFVAGNLKVFGMKMFHIDHPLDPENKYLNHAAIESSEVLNVYSGNITTDANGNADVQLPDWFEALNKNYRYQLTVIGQFAQAIVAEKINGNHFRIKTNEPNTEVSWQVTGVRSDPSARKLKFEIEEEKIERERGYYLDPEAFGQPEEKAIQWAHDPEGLKQMRQRRLEAEQRRKQQPNQR